MDVSSAAEMMLRFGLPMLNQRAGLNLGVSVKLLARVLPGCGCDVDCQMSDVVWGNPRDFFFGSNEGQRSFSIKTSAVVSTLA